MKTVNVADLKGAALDWAVATLEGWAKLRRNPHRFANQLVMSLGTDQVSYLNKLEFSTSWGQGGPIIERNFIALSSLRACGWQAEMWTDETNPLTGHHHFGGDETALIAAMRCFVASKVGNTIEIPDELL